MSNPVTGIQAVDLNAVYPQPYQKNYLARRQRKDQSWRRLATVNKIAQKAGYNSSTYREKRTIVELLNQHGEYAYLTGKRLGTFYLSTLDLDWLKEEFPKKLIKKLEKNATCLLDFLKVSWDKTKKGGHVDILTPEPLENKIVYRIDKLSKKWVIGSIQSKGKYVVGEDPNKTFIQAGKWYWKVKSNEEIKATLNKFFFILSNQEKPVKEPQVIEEPKTPLLPLVYDSVIPLPKHTIQAKILSKQKIPTSDLWKFFYSDNQGHRGYFLANGHTQKNLTDLGIGTVRNIRLVQGRKHTFFSCLL
jgi:hypothetical protein